MTRTTIASPTQRWSASSGSAAQTAIPSTTARTAILMISPAGELVPSAAMPNRGGFFSGGVSVAFSRTSDFATSTSYTVEGEFMGTRRSLERSLDSLACG